MNMNTEACCVSLPTVSYHIGQGDHGGGAGKLHMHLNSHLQCLPTWVVFL